MDTDNKPAADDARTTADLVVIDRRGLQEMLTAVVNTLRASQSLREMDAPDPPTRSNLRSCRRRSTRRTVR